ncbi:MAG: Protease HtpX-like protein [Candidatus Woesebacteria bacterium GW2011_GWA2_40_7]|uniref:Protease HtpX homolog n=3 Tax=Candidatus Woeseibacteriota TaxID=1752722 RepID=A0A0G0LUM6_9BACT|nr:MAG: Protease HtpX-like protein [Candidatus Woesebacteria bacterium GW2011_GWB1_39_10]KKR73669.1 MAG: Protease HtpX-like protein [Candidatus Woesebacteria bacterium GW2011_GWA2_40_7]KKS90692.1 MAG: Protease HtpX-like protein [Candidatus Woesebacteria bacterium GW2011_GWA1_43_12]
MRNIYEVQMSNKIKSAFVVALFVLFVFVAAYILTNAFGYYMGYQPGGMGYFGMAMIISGISSFVSYYYSDKIVLGISGARHANTIEDKLFTQVAENICIGAGIPKPKLYVIEDTAPNAFATGRDPDHAVICATTGLLSKLNRTELEGVLAHEISHIRNYDIRLMSIVSVMVGLVALLGDWFLRMSYFGRGSRDRDNGNIGAIFLVLGIIFAILSPIIAQLIQLAISRRREFTADAGSVEITRQPQGLISALKKISADTEPLEAANKATAHLYIVNPFHSVPDKSQRAVNFMAGLFNTHPPMPERITALQNMM